MVEGCNPNTIQNVEQARQCMVMLLNLVEELKAENLELRGANQRLHDAVNRLKGEQGRPNITPNKESKSANNQSSEKERHKPKEWTKSSKGEKLTIDREQVLEVDTAKLPADAEFKGYEEVVVQDIRIQTDTVLFRKEKYYSASEKKTYLAEVPRGYEGAFGPGSTSLVIVLSVGAKMSEPKMLELFANGGIQIAEGELSTWLIKNQKPFHAENDALYEAGLRSRPWQHRDDTATRVNGHNQHCHVVCNPLYTAYFMTEKKDRMTVLDVLRNVRERKSRLNAEAFGCLETFGMSARRVDQLREFPQEKDMREAECLGLLVERLPNVGAQQRRWVRESAAVAAYHAELECPVVRLVVCDDAPQFTWVPEEVALCWVHDGRHDKKLVPYVAYHRELLEPFLGTYWAFYDQLLNDRMNPPQKTTCGLPRSSTHSSRR